MKKFGGLSLLSPALALAIAACANGAPVTGSAGTAGASTQGTAGSTGSGTAGSGSQGTAGSSTPGTAGTESGASGTNGAAGQTGTGGAAGSAGGSGTAGMTGTAGTGGMAGGAAGTGMTGLRSGPFKILVLSTTLEFRHDSIPNGLQMLTDLGMANAPERAKIAGLAADSTWTVDHIGDGQTWNGVKEPDEFAAKITSDNLNLKNYEMLYSDNPTGKVFTNQPNGTGPAKKQVFVDFWNAGGSWAGQHSGTDFENSNAWTWFQDNINGGWFTTHDNDGTPGTVNVQAQYVDHPIFKNIPNPWNVGDEWYVMNRNIEAVPGFKVFAKVTVSNSMLSNAPRPAIWGNENTNNMGGRAFYTIRGHNKSVYAEPAFRQLMLQGILWAVHRLPGGN